MLKEGEDKTWDRPDDFLEILLGEDPNASIEAALTALSNGARPVELAQSVAVASAMRVARFHTQNEFSDWIAVLHTFTYANALHQMLKRGETPKMVRGLLHGIARIYLDRFLNVPPAGLPSSRGAPQESLDGFLEMLDLQQQTDPAGAAVYHYLSQGGDTRKLFRVLSESLLREDAEFHSFQVLEAAIRLHGELADEEEKKIVMVAAARYLAAHAPTQRELNQTLRIALRLHRGDPVYEKEGT